MMNGDLQKLSVGGVVTLYELDATALGADVIRFHGHTNFEDWQIIAGSSDPVANYKQDIIWQGQTFEPLTVQSEGLEVRGDGKASAPSLTLANTINGQPGAISALCLQFSDFAGAKLHVTYVLAKHLDSANFAQGNPQASSEHRTQTWYIEQKTEENGQTVTFELSAPTDFEGLKIPCREITNFCHWCVRGRYREEECGYTGTARFTEDGEPTTNPELDRCGGRLSDCRLRFGDSAPLPFGGFPASNMVNR